ncbi:MAG: alpha/beta hydrolase [Pseudomonadales bacterium]
MRKWITIMVLCAMPLSHADGINLASAYRVDADVTYLQADGINLKLDVYSPWRNSAEGGSSKLKTVVFFHGGGWMGGSKERSQLAVLPYLDKGWAAVNVQYRLGGTALAPAAVEDTRCALRWVVRNAEQYGIDTDNIVLTGRSAGGHLALITGMLTPAAGLDARCPVGKGGSGTDRASVQFPEMNVAAIVNWSGITDVVDLIDGPNATTYAVSWLGAQPDRHSIAQRVSPMQYVRKGIPPILTLHGDQDLVVPYEHAVRLHAALDDAGVPNQLHTLKGREHFVDYTAADNRRAYEVIDEFLREHLD